MSKRFALIVLTVFSAVISYRVNGQISSNGVSSSFVTTAVPFLRIDPDARSGAMGDAGIAISPDANAQYWNVAKLPFCDKNYGISMTYTPWLKDLVPDIFLAYLAAYAKFGEKKDKVISGSMRYFSLGSIAYTDALGNPIGTGMPREYSFDLGYSQKLSEFLSTGVSMRYIHSAIASGVNYSTSGGAGEYSPGNAFAADLGMYYTKKHEIDGIKNNIFSFGAVISNLGSKISYNNTRKDFIPMNLGVGIAYTTQWDEYNKVTFALDVNKLLVPVLNPVNPDTQVSVPSAIFTSFQTGNQIQELDMSLGAEYWYQNTIAFRAGYYYSNPNNGDLQYITAGIGARYNVIVINASYLVPQGTGTTRNPLSNTVRFSLIFEFDKIDKPADSGDDDSSK